MDYTKLQNGSDIRGVAMQGVEGEAVNLTEAAVRDIACAFAAWLKSKLDKKHVCIAIGRDSRLSGEALASWFADAARECGADVCDFGMATTPAMFMCTVTEGYMLDGAVMVTASHLPFNRNGFKFFTREGGLEKGDIKAILKLASEGGFEKADVPGKASSADFMAVYAKMLVDKIRAGVNAADYDKPLAGFKIVVDAGNGAGGFFVKNVLAPLGADTRGSVYLEPDGRFPNHAPNPEDESAMRAVTRATLEAHADMGIIFDTDVDRAGAVLSDGSELNRNRLIAMLAAILLRDGGKNTIVTDSITSTGLAEFITRHGGVHRRFRRGYRNVINESIRLNKEGTESLMAIETSGHGALRENYFLDDGAYLMVKLLTELARGRKLGYTLESLISDLKEPLESREFRMKFSCEDFQTQGAKIIEHVTECAKNGDGMAIAPDNHEGIRVSFDANNGDGWFLLRMSLHDPLMPLNIESDAKGGMKKIAARLYDMLKGFDALDTAELAAFASER